MKQRGPNNKRRLVSLIASVCMLATMSGSGVLADPYGHGPGGGGGGYHNQIQHVLLISVDGMHALDYLNCSANGTCPNLTALGTTGINYINTSTSKPSDSFPGLMALMTGGTPRTMGVNYDVAFDRALNPPLNATGNGLPAGPCTPGSAIGTTTEFDEGININIPGINSQMFLNGGAPSGDGGVNSIDSTRLERDTNCNPVYPWNFVRDNTIYGVIHAARGYTAWSDKHPSYSAVGGPTGTSTDTNVDDYYSPEINSSSQNFAVAAPPQLVIPECTKAGKPFLPDQFAVAAADDYTGSFQNIQCYDGLKVSAILNEIKGMNHDGTAHAPVPNIFGMNFQSVSIGEKLIYKDGPTVPAPYTLTGGYTDSIGTPTGSLLQEIEFVDSSIGSMVSELKAQHLIDSTLVIITAKHGQSPVDSSRYKPNGSPNDPASILSTFLAPSENSAIGPTEDDVALLWLQNPADTATAVSTLELASPVSDNIAGIGEIFSGPSIGLYWNIGDSRTPDILITPNIGVTYSNSSKKLAEHGGFAHDDVNVIMLVSNPSFKAGTNTLPVETRQVAPTVLKALGLDPFALQAVQTEGTQVLPGVPLDNDDNH
ncbi:alkaline phosphatase family protein [Candidatus Binatus sp.]|uniref:alkaline phosphatase family protein n=1 Tax=Candidatus Binatus sp. TaxID=2811406 RepID=UPI003C3DD48D